MDSNRPAFYRRDGDAYVSTGLGISPWNGTSQVGMALAGLAGHVIDRVPTHQPMLTTRISIDILGAVPQDPLVPHIRLLRDGKRIQIVDAEFYSGDRLWLRATAIRARLAEHPAAPVALTQRYWTEADHHDAHGWFEERHIDLDRNRVGPGSVWVRFTADVVEGEPLSPLATLAMMGDFGNGVAPVMPVGQSTLPIWTLRCRHHERHRAIGC